MLRTLSVIAALQVVAMSSACACTGQVGTSIFQDNFADDSGGWDTSPPEAVIKPPAFVYTFDKDYSGLAEQNLTFNATDGDYCMDFALPAPVAADNPFYAGIEFWAADYDNTMVADVSSQGMVELRKKNAGKWNNIFSVKNAPGFNAAPNAVNSLRVTALSGVITIYLNGQQVKVVRAQEPTNASLNFGIIIEMDKSVANGKISPVLVKGYSVTAGK